MDARAVVAVTMVLALGAGACSASGSDERAGHAPGGEASATTASEPPPAGAPTTAAETPGFTPDPLGWQDCGSGQDCATLAVPLDHDDPAGPLIELALRRAPAGDPEDRIGSLLVNPGGPGASGVDFVDYPFDDAITERFDVVGFDPRGVGASTALACGGDVVDAFLAVDSGPDSAAEQDELDAAARAVAEDCAARDGELLAHVGTDDVVRDIDLIRRALGAEQISFVGFSYGTLLGMRYADAFPAGARAIVLDGVVDPAHDLRDFLRGQTVAFEQTMADVFAACGDSPACPDAGGAAAYDELAARVEAGPLEAGGSELGPADLATAAIYVTYSPGLWSLFYAALADGLDGDGQALYDLAEGYRSFGGFTAYLAVECVDSDHPTGSAEYQAFAGELAAISPRFGEAIANELLPCAFWPVPPAGTPAPVSAPGAPPVLVIGNTGDAATPVEQAERVAAELESGVLLTYEGQGHTSYGSSECVDGAVAAYLVELRAPDPGTVCR